MCTNQEETRLEQLEQHLVHLEIQGAKRKWRKPKKDIKHVSHQTNEPNASQVQKKENDNDKCCFYRKMGHYQIRLLEM